MYFTQDRQFKILIFFGTLLPFSLIAGPAITELSVAVLSISCFFLLDTKSLDRILKNKYIIIFFIFYLIIILSSVLSNNILYCLMKTIPYLRYLLFSLSIFLILKNHKRFLNFFFISLCFANILLLFGSFYEVLTNSNILGAQKAFENRVSSFFGDEYIMGSYSARLLPLLSAAYLMSQNKNKKINILFFLGFISAVINIILSGERTAFVYMLFFIIPFLICFFTKSLFKKIFGFFFLLSIFIFLIISNPNLKKRYIDLTLAQFKSEKSIIFSEEHTQVYNTAYKIFLDHPIIGAGPNTYRLLYNDKKYYSGKHSRNTHPHNTYLQILSEVGLAGIAIPLILMLILSCKLFAEIFLNKNSNLIRISFYTSFLITLFPFIPSGNFFNSYLSIVYYLPFGFYLYYKNI
jgi:O-antigen ligase